MRFALFDAPAPVAIDLGALLSVFPAVGANLKRFLDEVSDIEAVQRCCAVLTLLMKVLLLLVAHRCQEVCHKSCCAFSCCLARRPADI